MSQIADAQDFRMAAGDDLVARSYPELELMARRFLAGWPPENSFEVRELIHEAFLRLANREPGDWKNSEHFLGVAGRAMRHILIDRSRASRAVKRRAPSFPALLPEHLPSVMSAADKTNALHDALLRLQETDPRKAEVVSLRFFEGLKIREVAERLKISVETANRDWRFARQLLYRELSKRE